MTHTLYDVHQRGAYLAQVGSGFYEGVRFQRGFGYSYRYQRGNGIGSLAIKSIYSESARSGKVRYRALFGIRGLPN